MTSSPDPAENRRSLKPLGLHLLTLSCIAFAHPVLDLLGRSAEFLVIRRLGPGGVLAMIVALVVVLPIPILIVALLGERYGRTPGRILNGLIVASLFALIVLRMISAASLLDGPIAVGAVVFLGLAAGLAYQRSEPFRSFVTWLSPALLVVPLFFILRSDVRRAIFSSGEGQILEASGARNPIFFLVFDELSLASVVNGDGLVDRDRYPNLAALADGATWYRNAHTVADTTNMAIPAMLSSRFPGPDELPLLADHPKNIFTLFGGDYRIRAEEPITRLCPLPINEYERDDQPLEARARELGSDLGVVWLHLVLPASYRERLPSISNTWEGFIASGEGGSRVSGRPVVPSNSGEFFVLAVDQLSKRNRIERFREFLSSIDPATDQSLYFTHVLLPHVPWEYLPSGRMYTGDRGRTPGLVGDFWKNDPESVRVAEVRYLMQVELVDRLVGELIATLERNGMYDKSLIVLVADHGASFRPGDRRRAYTATNAPDILPVPLWIKAPGQTKGEVVDASVSILDILPTMIDILGIDVPWEFEGHSTRSLSESPEKYRVSTKYEGELTVSVAEIDARKRATALELGRQMGPLSDPYRFSHGAPHPELLGKSVGELHVREGDVWAVINNPPAYESYEPDARVLPLFVEGSVKTDREDCCDIALATRGQIVATAKSYPVAEGRGLFHAILPDTVLQRGFNDMQILVVDSGGASGSGPVLERTVERRHESYALSAGEDGRVTALNVDGADYQLGGRLDGWIEGVDVKDGWVRIHGWAADSGRRRLSSEVVVFYRDQYLAAGPTWLPMGHVVQALGEPGYMFSGYSFSVPLSSVPDIESYGVRAFTFSDEGRAIELHSLFLPLEKSHPDRLAFSSGKKHPIRRDALDGRVDLVTVENGVRLEGWAADLEKKEPAVQILVYFDGKCVTRTEPTEDRRDLLPDRDEALHCGFGIFFNSKPEGAKQAVGSGKARVFAISRDGSATEMKIRTDR